MPLWSLIAWWAPLPAQLALLLLMARRQAFRVFPWFFIYTAYSVTATSLRFVARKHNIYPYLYWSTDGIYALLGIAVMYEVFSRVFHQILRTTWLRALFPVTVCVTLILAVAQTATSPRSLGPIMTWVVGAEMGTRIIEVALFVLLVALVPLLGLRWRQHAFGICAGFGIYSSCALLASTKYYEIGSRFNFWWSVISVVSYTVAVLIWLWYFSSPIRADAQNSEQPPLSLSALERYKEIARRVPRP